MPLEDININPEAIVGYGKTDQEMSSIFDEIEQLLRNNECLEISPKERTINTSAKTKLSNNLQKASKAVQQPAALNAITDSEAATLDFLPTCGNHEFLTSVDPQVLPEDELSLYSVNQNELQPVNAPFMVPGIYKKIANASGATSEILSENAAKESTNVFFAAKCSKGKIISRTDFENDTVADNSYEHHSSNVEEELTSTELKSDGKTNNLLTFACSLHKAAQSDRIVIDTKGNEVTRTRAATNQKVIYRLLGPEELNLQTNSIENLTYTSPDENRPLKHKLGRPKKHALDDGDKHASQVSFKKHKLEQNVKAHEPTESETNIQQPLLRTRSGRVVKLLKPQLNTVRVNETPAIDLDHVKSLINDSKDKDFHGSVLINPLPSKTDILSSPPISGSPTQKRRVPPESICPKCGKIFLGRRLKRHFTQHPDHMLASTTEYPPIQQPQQHPDNESTTEDMTLFRFLISKLQKPLLNEDQRADLFLNELNDLVVQLQLRSARLIRNTSGLHFVSARTARILGIPEGQYALDMSAIDTETPPLDTEQHSLNGEELKRHDIMPPVGTVNTPNLDYTAISLDNTLTDEAAQKLNLSAGGKLLPPSEESLLRVADDLVHDGMAKLVDTNLLHPPRTVVQSSGVSTLVPHYDHVSDNAVEALTVKENNAPQEGTPLLDLPVDFFQFKNNRCSKNV
ncbi:uncharacterized protein LOC128858230 [Anastrepha ludens]|uniref:uncharacterized protein LOC128858230 n=1 Tax=Anastrepha ludens TaxID=28586 RepID=UPI0023B06254|nr:uncharacterized protein LOC128858230 [Anastrepha ludens]